MKHEIISALAEGIFYFSIICPLWLFPIGWICKTVKKIIGVISLKVEKAQTQPHQTNVDDLFFLDIDGECKYYEMH